MQLVTHGLHKSYRDADRELVVINSLTITFPEKGTVGIIGRSGIGKSTLLHMLGLLDSPSRGTVIYDGMDVGSLPVNRRTRIRGERVGFIFQFHHLLPEFSAVENVAIPLIMSGLSESKASERARGLLNRMGLSQREKHRPGQLSGGEQQRVAIARALVTNPQLILADEPTGNLDVTTANDVQELLQAVNRELGNLMIIVTHNQALARSMDMVLEMKAGGDLVAC